jgi:hypothetical protein
MQMPFRAMMTGGVATSAAPFAMNANMLGRSLPSMAGGSNMALSHGNYTSPTGGYGSGSMMYGAGSSMPGKSSGYGYGSPGNEGSGAAGNYDIAAASMRTTTAASANVLSAMGVPNDGGQIAWPFELRVMGPAEVTGLRSQLQGLLQVVAMQAASGQVNPRALLAAQHAVARMETLLLEDKERGGLGMTSFEDSERFLHQLRDGLKLLQ